MKGFVLGVYDRFGWEADPGFRARLVEDRHRGKGYKSRHTYSLTEFGLTEEGIRSRFQGFNKRFGFDEPAPDSMGGEEETG